MKIIVGPHHDEPIEPESTTHVRFVLGERWDEAIDVRVESDGKGAYLYVQGLAMHGLAVEPHSGNVVRIRQPGR